MRIAALVCGLLGLASACHIEPLAPGSRRRDLIP
jgi:hypothetical protein